MSLKNLINLQKQKQVIESAGAEQPPAKAPAVESESQQVEQPTTKPKGLGLNTVKAGQKFTPAQPKAQPSAQSVSQTKSASEAHGTTMKDSKDSSDFSLADLASMDAASIPEPERNESTHEFPDEIEATAPDRELPADLTTEQISFVESLDAVYSVLHDSEMFGQTVRMIMLELQENPEYEKLLSDPDVHVMIRGMRRTMGLARVRKQEKTRKVATNKNARKTSGLGDSALALLNGLMGGGDD